MQPVWLDDEMWIKADETVFKTSEENRKQKQKKKKKKCERSEKCKLHGGKLIALRKDAGEDWEISTVDSMWEIQQVSQKRETWSMAVK